MPKFLANNKSEVLVDYQNGKRYLGRPWYLFKQRAQKSHTCWYYAMNHIRPRYGKFSKDPNRKNEIIFSNYRKNISKIQARYCSSESLTKSEYLDALIINSRNTLKLFGIVNIEKYVKLVDAKLTCKGTIKSSEKIRQNAHYHRAVLHKAREIFGIKTLGWGPKSSFEDFMEQIRLHGKLVVQGYFGKPFYHDNPKILTINGRYLGIKIKCYRNKDYIEPKRRDLVFHQIIVVGAVRDGVGGGFIYYLDPNDELNPSKNREVYLMRYDFMCKRLTSIYDEYQEASYDGIHFKHMPEVLKGPFAMAAGVDLQRLYKINDFMIRHYEDMDEDYDATQFKRKFSR